MEFTPFKPVSQVINFVEKPKNQSQAQAQIQREIQKYPTVLKGIQKDLGSRYAFIEKHRLIELKSDLTNEGDGTEPSLSYYYDQRSNTVFEIRNSGPVVFMKSTPEVSKHLLKLNNL